MATSQDVPQAHYPALHRLERKGLITAEWQETDSGRLAKVHLLTPAGRKQFLAERDQWNRNRGRFNLCWRLSGYATPVA